LQVSHENPAAPSEEALLARRIMDAAPARDIAAEAALYRALAPRVRLYGLKHLRDAHGAADLVQDVLLMALERLRQGEVREPKRIASFVLGACRQTVIDQKRQRQRRHRLLDIYADTLPPVDAAPVPALDTERLQHCLQLLPERERTVLVMTFFDDSNADEVAHATGITAGNARVVRHRGIERLRRCLEGQVQGV
jgi:RNA polymerase sigma-70 factor (ECF subfamily)